jgi:hypothetical protein
VKESIIYNIRHEIIDHEVYFFFGALLFLAIWLIYYNFYKAEPGKRIESCWNGLLLLLVSVMVLAWQATKDLKEHRIISSAYQNVEVKYMEGIITDHDRNKHGHNFSIEDKTFHYSLCFTECNTLMNRRKKSDLIKESVRAKISYMSFNDRNIILEMAVY